MTLVSGTFITNTGLAHRRCGSAVRTRLHLFICAGPSSASLRARASRVGRTLSTAVADMDVRFRSAALHSRSPFIVFRSPGASEQSARLISISNHRAVPDIMIERLRARTHHAGFLLGGMDAPRSPGRWWPECRLSPAQFFFFLLDCPEWGVAGLPLWVARKGARHIEEGDSSS